MTDLSQARTALLAERDQIDGEISQREAEIGNLRARVDIAKARRDGIDFALDLLPGEDVPALVPKPPAAERMTSKKLGDKIIGGLTVAEKMDGFTLAAAHALESSVKIGKTEAALNRLVTVGTLERTATGWRLAPPAPPERATAADFAEVPPRVYVGAGM